MPLNDAEIIKVVGVVCTDKDLQVTVTESMKAGATVGVFTTAGAVLGGIIGLAIGSAIGTGIAMYNGKGKFKSVISVINEMSAKEKQLLANSMRAVFDNVDVNDVAVAITFFMAGGPQELLVKQLSTHLLSKGMKLVMQ